MKEIENDLNEIEFSFSLYNEKNLLPSNCIYYGPIRFYRRRGKAPTLLTGRRSRFEQLDQEQQKKRELRRQKNRLLSKQLKQKRDNIQKELIQQIKQLEEKQFYLINQIEQLELYKKELNQKLEDPLYNLIHHPNISLFFQEYDHSNFDIIHTITTLTDQQSSTEDLFSIDNQSIVY